MDKKYDVVIVGGGPSNLPRSLFDPTYKVVKPIAPRTQGNPKMLSNMQKVLMLTAGIGGEGLINSFLEEKEKAIIKENKPKEITDADLKRIEQAKLKRERRAAKLSK